jgi:hypothetical protein
MNAHGCIATTDMGAYEFIYQIYLPLILKNFEA